MDSLKLREKYGTDFYCSADHHSTPFCVEKLSESLAALPFGRAYFNSFYIAAIVVVVQLLTASMAGYAFAKLKFKGHNVIFVLFLATMMIPSQVTMIPLFIIMKNLKLLGTHWSLILPASLFNAFGVFLMRQFTASLPDELEEAAIIDGASVPQIFFKIIMPLIKPSMAAFWNLCFPGSVEQLHVSSDFPEQNGNLHSSVASEFLQG